MAGGTQAINLALFGAAEEGDVRALQSALRPGLLRRRADVNARDGDGWTPLHQAAAYGQDAAAQILINGGAQVEAQDSLGLTPLQYAACYGHNDVADVLVRRGARHSLHTAAALGATGALCYLLEATTDPQAWDYFGYTALHWAARHGRFEAMHMLLDRGLDPDCLDINCERPLHRAMEWGHDHVAQLLRLRGAAELENVATPFAA